MKPVVRVLQWLLGTFLGLGLITLVAAAIITPLVFNLLWPPPPQGRSTKFATAYATRVVTEFPLTHS